MATSEHKSYIVKCYIAAAPLWGGPFGDSWLFESVDGKGGGNWLFHHLVDIPKLIREADLCLQPSVSPHASSRLLSNTMAYGVGLWTLVTFPPISPQNLNMR